MRLKTSRTGGNWVEAEAPSSLTAERSDLANQEASRFLTFAIRSPNLVVLAGLGASLCIEKDERPLAPTMDVLRRTVRERLNELDQGEGGVPGTRWQRLLALANIKEPEPDLEYLLSRVKLASDLLSPTEASEATALLEGAEDAIRNRVDFVTSEVELPVHEAFLRRIARRSARLPRIKVFTTNYDLSFEVAGRRSSFVVVDGFAFGSEASFQPEQFALDVVRRSEGDERSDYIPNLFHLYKMHGSIDWEWDSASQTIRKAPKPKRPLLIYPRSTKYELAFSHPYLEMMSSFQAALRMANTTLLVLGFGFNDKHISEPIIAAVRSNLSLDVIVVDPTIEGRSSGPEKNAYLSAMDKLIDGGDARIALLETKFEDIVPHIPDVIAETELERHQERVRSMGFRHVESSN